MDITRLFAGIVMMLPVGLVVWLVANTDVWRGAVMALHLTWEREQRQAAPNGVAFPHRQSQQTKFEELVTGRPMRLLRLHVAITLLAIAFSLLLSWNQEDLRWIGLWLVLPIGLAALIGSGFAWLQLNSAGSKLSSISSSLYGPAPPRVKVKSIQVQEPDSQP